MPDLVAILEDNSNRIADMRACLADLLPGVDVRFFDTAITMIAWLTDHLGDAILISLDHDLPLRDAQTDQSLDCGTGRQVADFLATLPPTCPVIIHSSNQVCAPGMYFALRDAGWPCARVYPHDDLAWIHETWSDQIRQYIHDGWIVREPPRERSRA